VIGLFSPSLKAVAVLHWLYVGSKHYSHPVNDSLNKICIDIDNFNALLNRTLYNDACVLADAMMREDSNNVQPTPRRQWS